MISARADRSSSPATKYDSRDELGRGRGRTSREADAEIDYPAVMGSRRRLWQIFGPAWAWPKDTMTMEADRRDLRRHEEEIAAHQSFNYALIDEVGVAGTTRS